MSTCPSTEGELVPPSCIITGVSGRFPSSESISDFWSKLKSGEDLVSESTRHPKNYYGLPGQQAQVRNIEKFDAMFFGVSASQANCLDPQIRYDFHNLIRILDRDELTVLPITRFSPPNTHVWCCPHRSFPTSHYLRDSHYL